MLHALRAEPLLRFSPLLGQPESCDVFLPNRGHNHANHADGLHSQVEVSQRDRDAMHLVIHGHYLPPRTLPRPVRITITTLHAFTISRQSRTLVSSLLPCYGFRFHWADLYFDLCGTLRQWLPALALELA